MTASKLLIALVVLGLSSASFADSIKIGYVNLQSALETVDAGKQAKDKLEKTASAKKLELEQTQAKLQKEAEEFEKKAAILSERAKLEKQNELQKKFVDFQKRLGQSQLELQNLERELTGPIIKELKSIVEALGEEKNFTLVLEKSESAVLFAKGGEDLTEEVISRFDKARKKGGKKG